MAVYKHFGRLSVLGAAVVEESVGEHHVEYFIVGVHKGLGGEVGVGQLGFGVDLDVACICTAQHCAECR